jgi:serine/threonine protein kinase
MTFPSEHPTEGGSQDNSAGAGETPTHPFHWDGDGTENARQESYEKRYPTGTKLGKYAVEGVLGWGGMGVVVKGFDPDLHRTVAIKVLGPHLAHSPTARRRFQREARAVASICHPNVLTIHAVEQQQTTPFIVMEYVAGCSLRDYVAKRGPLQPDEVMRFSAQIAQGLAAAHAQGVIHRDVKPGNVMLDQGGTRAKLADFGLARATFDNAELTSHDQAVGTPAYMAPEQLRAETIDARADLFSFGCVIYFMLTGHSPFDGRTPGETTFKILEDKPVSLVEIEDTAPKLLRQIVERLLSKDPANRFPSAFEVSEALSRFLLQMNQTETDRLPELMATHSPTGNRPAEPKRGKRLSAAIVVGFLILVLCGAGLLWDRWNDQSDELPASAPIAGPAPPIEKQTEIRVGDGADCDCQTISEAIRMAAENCTITVTGSQACQQAVVISGSALNGLKLLGQSVRWVSPADAEHVSLEIQNVANVEIAGFVFEVTGDEERAVKIAESTGNLLCRDCRFVHTAESPKFSLVWISSDARNATDRIRFHDCDFVAAGDRMCVSISDAPRAYSRVEFDHCTFSGPATHLYVTDSCRDLKVSNSVFLGGANAVNLSFVRWQPDSRLQVINSTFADSRYWLGLMDSFRRGSAPDPGGDSRVCNNLILGGERVMGGHDQWEIVLSAWEFKANWWEIGPNTHADAGRGDRLATMKDKLSLGPRDDPTAPNFLAPAAESPLATSGCGGDLQSYIGAIPPLPGK